MSDVVRLSVVIPNFNRKQDILESLASLQSQQEASFEIIVVDDCSTDGSVAAIRQAFPQVRVVEHEKNQGPAVARNTGIQQSVGDIIVGIDSDVVLQDTNTLKAIVDKFDALPELNCMAMRVLNREATQDDRKTWWHPRPIESHAQCAFYSDYFSGTGYAFRREVFDRVGLFPDDIFMDTEENDLSVRIIDGGFDIVYCPSIAVIHKVSAQGRNNRIAFYLKRRNQIWFAAKYYPWLMAVTYIFPRLVKTFGQACVAGQLQPFCKAVGEGLGRWSSLRKDYPRLGPQTLSKVASIRSGQYDRAEAARTLLEMI